MKAIALPVYNRPHYTATMLESIRFAEDYELFAVFDKSENTDTLIALVRRYEARFKKLHIEVNDPRKGMIQNAYDNIEWAFRMGATFMVCIEDDLWLSPDFFKLMSWYEKRFRKAPLSYGAYGGQGGNINDVPDTLISDTYFYGNGWAVFAECWEKWFRPNWFSSDYAQKHFGAFGNDWNISGTFREFSVKMLIPTLARSKHIGVIGQHHNEKVFKKLCADKVVNTTLCVEDYRIVV